MPKPAAPIRILDILKSECVLLDLKSASKKDLICEIAHYMLRNDAPEIRDEVVTALLEREKLGSTGIGSGVAVPHAKSSRVANIVCAFGVSNNGIEFEALDQAPVYLVFLLVAPPSSQSEHLNILARIVRLLKDRVFRQALREAKSKEDVLSLIAAEDV